MTLFHAAMKSLTNLSLLSSWAYTSAMARNCELLPTPNRSGWPCEHQRRWSGPLADVEQLLEHVGPDHDQHRLYISAEVTYLPEDTTPLNGAQQALLRDTVSGVLHHVGAGMNIQEAVLTGWVEDFCNEHLDGTSQSVYHVASLLLNSTEARQQVLAAGSVAEAMEELHLHVNPGGFEEE